MHRLNRIEGSFKYCHASRRQAMSTPGSTLLQSSLILREFQMNIFLDKKKFLKYKFDKV